MDTAYFSRRDAGLRRGPRRGAAGVWAPLSISLDDQANDGAKDEGDNLHADVENVDTTAAAFGGGSSGWRTGAGCGSRRSPTAEQRVRHDRRLGRRQRDPHRRRQRFGRPEGRRRHHRLGAGDDQSTPSTHDGHHPLRARDGQRRRRPPGYQPGPRRRADGLRERHGHPLRPRGRCLPLSRPRQRSPSAAPRPIRVKKFLRNYTVTADVTTDQPATAAGELTVAGARIAKVGALAIGSGKLQSGTGKRKLKVKVAVEYRKASSAS